MACSYIGYMLSEPYMSPLFLLLTCVETWTIPQSVMLQGLLICRCACLHASTYVATSSIDNTIIGLAQITPN